VNNINNNFNIPNKSNTPPTRINYLPIILLFISILLIFLIWFLILRDKSVVKNSSDDNIVETESVLVSTNKEESLPANLNNKNLSTSVNEDETEDKDPTLIQGEEQKSDDKSTNDKCTLQGRVYVFGDLKEGVEITAKYRHEIIDIITKGKVTRFKCISEKNGFFEFEGLPPGRYLLTASYKNSDGRYSQLQEEILKRNIEKCTIYIGASAFGRFSCKVYKDTIPWPGFNVHLYGRHYSSWKTTDESGYTAFSNVPAGEVWLHYRFVDQLTPFPWEAKKRYTLDGGESITDEIYFKTGTGILSGRVLIDNKPEVHDYIIVEQVGNPGTVTISKIVAVRNGDWFVENIPEGNYRVVMGRKYCKPAVVFNNQETRVDFNILTGSATIQGSVYAAGRMKRLSEAPVYLFHPGTCSWKTGEYFIPPTSADGLFAQADGKKNGGYSISNIPQGAYELVAVDSVNGKIKAIKKMKVTISDGEKQTIDFHLTG